MPTTRSIIGRIAIAATAAGLTCLAGMAMFRAAGWSGDDEHSPEIVSASLVVERFSCRRGETRHVEWRGQEDGYASEDAEPARATRAGDTRMTGIGLRDFDQTGLDMELFDYFEPPRDLTSGLLVIRMYSQDTGRNDTILVGDYPDDAMNDDSATGDVFRNRLQSLAELSGWTQAGDVYWTDLGDISLESGRSLIDFVRDPDEEGLVDISVGDDTVVDAIALVTCSPPESGTGMTFFVRQLIDADGESPGVVRATCYPQERSDGYCDPFVGETRCNRALPVVCFRPGVTPFPVASSGPGSGFDSRFWTGGDIALTPPVAGDEIATIADADALCRAEFGEDWRAGDFHLGGRGFLFQGAGTTEYEGRAWVDIRDQPYANCWSRQ